MAINFQDGRVESMLIFSGIPSRNQKEIVWRWIDSEVRAGTSYQEIIDLCQEHYGLVPDNIQNRHHLIGVRSISDNEFRKSCELSRICAKK